MQHILCSRHLLTTVHRHGAAGIDDDNLRPVLHPLDHVVQEQVGLALHRVGAHQHDRVGQLVILIGIVQLVHAHVAGRMNLGIVGGAVVDAAVLDLHRPEIELAGAPGVLIPARRTAMVEHGDIEIVLVVLVDHAGRDTGDEVECVIPACGLPCAIAPDHRFGQALLLGAGDVGPPVLGHPCTADRAEAGVHLAIHVRLDDQMDVLPVLLDHVIHGRRIPSLGFRTLLGGEIDAKLVRCGIRATLLLERPCIGFVAASHDTVVAGDVVFPGIRRDDRQAVDVAFVSHFRPLTLAARWTDGRRSARLRLRHRCRPRHPPAGRIGAGSG